MLKTMKLEQAREALIAYNDKKLRDYHAKGYQGLDDDMSDDFDNWISDLSYEEISNILQ